MWHSRTSSSTPVGVAPSISRILSCAVSGSVSGVISTACGVIDRDTGRGGLGFNLCCDRTDIMLAALSVRTAPWRIRSLVPLHRGSRGEPGMANTSRLCSRASRDVINESDLSAASTTSTPWERPEISRFRAGKCRAVERVPTGCSQTSAPVAAIRSYRSSCSGG